MEEVFLNHQPNNSGSLVVSYLTLRKAIGVLGISLPFILSLGALIVFKTGFQTSISGYYYTGMRDVFVGTLCAIGVFLFSYKGYERKDDLAGNFASVSAIGVALFPTAPVNDPTSLQEIISNVHLVFAALFFLTLAYFSLCLFTKSEATKPRTAMKRCRNLVYIVFGCIIVASIVLIVVHGFLPANIKQAVSAYNPVYWLESIAVVSFGISWLTKGEAILWDKT